MAIAESHGGIAEALTQMGEFRRARPTLDLAREHTDPTGAAGQLREALEVCRQTGNRMLEREILDILA